MAERSKAPDSSSGMETCVGSNPTACIFFKKRRTANLVRGEKSWGGYLEVGLCALNTKMLAGAPSSVRWCLRSSFLIFRVMVIQVTSLSFFGYLLHVEGGIMSPKLILGAWLDFNWKLLVFAFFPENRFNEFLWLFTQFIWFLDRNWVLEGLILSFY